MNTNFMQQVDEVVFRRHDVWSALDKKSIFITGGTGFTGRWILETLVRAQNKLGLSTSITVLTRAPKTFIDKMPHIATYRNIKFIQGDIRSFDDPSENYDYIIHGAATSAQETYDGENPLNKFDIASQGTRRVLELAVRTNVQRLLIISSGSVYGCADDFSEKFNENYRVAPLTFDIRDGLSHGKRAAEFQAACYAEKYDLSLSVARCFTFVGAFLPLSIHYAIGNFIRDAMFAESVDIKSDGSSIRSYMFAGDLVTWLLVIMLQGKPNTIYNVGSDEGITIANLARLVRDIIAPDKNVRILGQSNAGLINRYLPDIAAARHELDLDVWTSLHKSIVNTVETAKSMPWYD